MRSRIHRTAKESAQDRSRRTPRGGLTSILREKVQKMENILGFRLQVVERSRENIELKS